MGAKKKNAGANKSKSSRSGSVPAKSARGEEARFDSNGGASTNPAVFDAQGIAESLGLFWEEGAGEKFLLGMDFDEGLGSAAAGTDELSAQRSVNGSAASQGRFGSYSEWTKGMVEKWIRQRVFDKSGRMICMKARDGNQGEEEMTSEMVRVLLAAMEERKVWVAFDGLAGYMAGDYLIQGRRVLVKRSPKRLDFSAESEGLAALRDGSGSEWSEDWFPTVRMLIEGLLDGGSADVHGNSPSLYFHAWMKLSLESMLCCEPGEWRSGQALIFAGERNSGKSRIQNQLITPLLGGRMADPGKYLFGKTDFNGELIYAEHLQMEDPENGTKSTDRIAFGEKVKGLVANDWHSLHKKKEDALMGSPFWRVTISVNDDPDKLRVLPMLTPDMKDKVMVFHVLNSGNAGLPDGGGAAVDGVLVDDLAQRREWRDRISAELVGYGHWLLNDFVIPEEMQVASDGRRARFGVNAFLDEDLCSSMSDETPSSNLLALIHAAEFSRVGKDDHGFDDDGSGDRKLKLWELPAPVNMGTMGRAGEGDFDGSGWWWAPIKQGPLKLQRLLCADSRRPEEGWVCSMAPEADKLMGKYPNACEMMLKRLAEDEPERVARGYRDRDAGRGWVIASPEHVVTWEGKTKVSLARRPEEDS